MSWEWLDGEGPVGSTDEGGTPIARSGDHLIGIAPDYSWELRRTICYINWGIAVDQIDPTAGSLEPGWWLGIQAIVGLWCDAGTGAIVPNASAAPPAGNNWLWRGMLENTLGVDGATRPGTTDGWRYQVKLGVPGGVIDVESIRPAQGTANPPRIYLCWSVSSWNTIQVNTAPITGFFTPLGGSSQARALWKSPS